MHLAILILASIPATIYNGFVLSKLWSWFINPIFQFPNLSLIQAIGVMTVVSFLTHQWINNDHGDKDETEKLIFNICYSVIRPTFALLGGWIITLFL